MTNSFNTQIFRIFFRISFLLWVWSTPSVGEIIDRIVAVVEDDVILESELIPKINAIKQKIAAQNTPLPPDFVIGKQVLERMVINKLQLQLADRSGITVSDEVLRKSMLELAQRNSMTLTEFRQALDNENINYESFVEDMRNEILVGRLRTNQVNSKIEVTDRELEHHMETEGKHSDEQKIQYHLAHILIATPEAASPPSLQSAKEKAETAVDQLRNEADFRQMAISISDGAQALNGGDLGWRNLSQIPTVFVDAIISMTRGSIKGPIRSPSGFHIIKLVDIQGVDKHIVNQTKARHILIKTNELINDEDAKQRLLVLKDRIENGEEFTAFAQSHSDDKASALKGGDLGWIEPGALVPPFERAMNQLDINQISEPVQTQFGWHMIQVLERQKRDNTLGYKKAQARQQISKRKIEEQTELWLRRVRDEAYVKIILR